MESTIPADIWYSTDTLAIVKVNAVLNLSLPGTNFTAGSTISIAGNPPQTIQWPLTAGASWSSTTLVWTKSTASNGTTTYGSASLTTVFNVQPDATITVPAGTFTTTPLKETPSGVSAGYVVVYWAPQAGNSARTETYNSTGHDQGGSNLTAYNYQASNFLFANYLGLQGYVWLIILAIVVVLIAAVVIMRRRRPRMPMTMPPQQPPMQPYEPPQGPPGTGP